MKKITLALLMCIPVAFMWQSTLAKNTGPHKSTDKVTVTSTRDNADISDPPGSSDANVYADDCTAADIPFTQDFESIETPAIPDCASLETNNGDDWVTFNQTSNGFDSNVLRHKYTGAGDGPVDAWYFTKGVNLETGQDYQIKFKYGNNNDGYSEKLKVAYGTSAGSSSMNDELIDLTDISEAEADETEVNFTVDQDGVYYFGFQVHSDENQYYVYVDDIVVKDAPSCVKPTDLEVDNSSITTSEADLTWSENNSATEWDVVYGEPGFDPTASEGTSTTVTGTPETSLTGLNSGTTYDVYVKSNCSASDESDFSDKITFTTVCAPLGDFVEKFDTTPNDSIPNCWSTLKENSTSQYAYLNVNESSSAYSTPNDFKFSNSSDETGEFYLVTPEINNLDDTDHRLRFFYNGNEDMSLVIGTMTDPSDSSTFTSVETVSTTEGYNEYSVNFDQGSSDSNIAFKVVFSATYQSVYLDDVHWEPTPSCIKPSDFTVDEGSITASSVDISWSAGDSETDWVVLYGVEGFDTEGSEGTSVEVSGTAETSLTDLDPDTSYELYVKAQCGGPDGSDDSVFAGPESFSTTCIPASIPFDEGFENDYTGNETLDGCWSQENGDWFVRDEPASHSQKSRTGDWYVSLQYGNTDWIFYALDLTGGTEYDLSFYARQDATSGASVTASFGTNNSADAMNTEIIASTDVTSDEYEEFSGTFTPDSDGLYFIGIQADLTYAPWYLTIDDISVTEANAVDCAAPSEVSFANTASDSTDVSWTENGSATEWEVLYGEEGFDTDTEGTSLDVTDGVDTTLTDLSADTSYEVYVRATCDDNNTSDWTGPELFTTEAGTGDGGNTCDDPILVSNLPYNDSGSISDYGNNYSGDDIPDDVDPDAITDGTGSTNYLDGYDAVYSFTPSSDEIITISTELDIEGWHGIYVFKGCPFSTVMGYNTSTSGDSRIIENLSVTGGETYYVVVSDWDTEEFNYTIDITKLEECSNVDAGTAMDDFSACPSTAFTLENDGVTEGDSGLSYQWEKSEDGENWSDIDGATTVDYTVEDGIESEMYYRLTVDCESDNEDTSEAIHVTLNNDPADCFCTPSVSNVEAITLVDFSDLLDDGSNTSDGYIDNTDLTAEVDQSTSYDIALEGDTNGSSYTNYFTVWIDWSQDGVFTDDEMYEIGSIQGSTGDDGQQATGTIDVPGDASVGQARMRVIKNYASSPTDPCDGPSYGQVKDYTVNVAGSQECIQPTAIIIDNIDDSSANVSWTTGDSETEWEVLYGESGFDPETEGTSLNVTEAADTTLSDLTASTDYEVYVRAVCSEDNLSEWAGPESFTTDMEPCPMPTDIIIDTEGITSSSAVISWSENGTATEWEVLYGESGFDPQTEGESVTVEDDPQAIIEGLNADTEYEVYVRAICGEDNLSEWAGPETFNTPLGVDDYSFESFSFYPNPVKGQLNLKANTQIENVVLFNLRGQRVLENSPNAPQGELNTQGLSAGVYLMKVSIDGNEKTFRVIKE